MPESTYLRSPDPDDDAKSAWIERSRQQVLAERERFILSVVLDNWPVHFHPDVLAAVEPQRFPWPVPRPANWPTTPRPSVPRLKLPIQLLCLPTYASWINLIQKRWRWIRQQVINFHRRADAWDCLTQRVADFMDRFRRPSPELLHHIGLLPD